MAKMTGTITKLVYDRGYGFLDAPGNHGIFFHRSALRPPAVFDDLVVGTGVMFELGMDASQRRRAEDVQVIAATAAIAGVARAGATRAGYAPTRAIEGADASGNPPGGAQ